MSEGAGRVDDADFAAAVDRHYPGLVQRLTLVLHDPEEAKDVAQETYMRAFRAWERFDGSDVRAWLHTIGLRLAFNHLSRRRLLQRWLRAQPKPPASVLPERVDLWRGLAALRPRQRAALLFNVVDGYTQAEIARSSPHRKGQSPTGCRSQAPPPRRAGRGAGAVTSDDRLHADLEALERSAPTDLPPRPPLPGRRPASRVVLPAAATLAAALLLAILGSQWLAATRPPGSNGPTASGDANATPTPTAPAAVIQLRSSVDAFLTESGASPGAITESVGA